MQTIHKDPPILLSPWEDNGKNKECMYITAVIQKGKATLLVTIVKVESFDDSEQFRKRMLDARLLDMLGDIKNYSTYATET